MAVPVTFKVFKGEELIGTREFDQSLIKIGRLASTHLCLDDEKVSRIHSVIEVGGDGQLTITDMGSVEGTFVNGKRVNKGALSLGDEIRVGNTTIKIEAIAANLAAAAQAVEPAAIEESTQVVKAAAISGRPERSQTVPHMPQVDAGEDEQESTAVGAPVQPPAPPAAALAQTAAVAAGAPRVRGGRRKAGSGPLGLELRFMWGAQMVGEYLLKPGAKGGFNVGSGSDVQFVMGDSKLGGPKFEVVRPEGDGFSLRFTGKMKGELHRKGQVYDLKHVIEAGMAQSDGEAYSLTLGQNDFAWVDLGNVELEVSFQPVPKAAVVPFMETIDFSVLNIFLLMLFLGAMFVITALNNEANRDQYADELDGDQARIAKLLVKPPQVEKNRFLERLAQQKEAQSGQAAAKHRKEEGKMGKKDAPKRNTRTAPKGDPNNKDQARMMLSKVFGGNNGGISTIFGKQGLGGELKSAMGNMFGAAPGDAQGFGGLGIRGSGAGGGGVGNTIGVGGIGTKGRGGGMGQYGEGVGLGMGGKKSVDIGITSSEPTVMGSLDKELIRQVIRSHAGQIRYCYESQLTRYPNISGKVTVKFVISANGSVVSSTVGQSSVGNAELETCVAGRVRTWIFPKPKGGGIVNVSYPFIFKKSGE